MIPEGIEQYLQENILPELDAGRPHYDRPHTIEVVHEAKAIIINTASLVLDATVLITACYLHDIGYAHLFPSHATASFNAVKDVKELHMQIGAKKAESILDKDIFSNLTLQQKQRIIYLVAHHDKLETLHATDEIILMEADTLGSLVINDELIPFDKASNEKFIQAVKRRRLPLFITDYGKREFERLFSYREEYYAKILD